MRGYRGRNGRLSVREEATFIQWCRAAVAYKAADPGDKQVALLRRRKVLAERHWRAFNAPLTRPRVRQRFGPTLRNLRGERLSPPRRSGLYSVAPGLGQPSLCD